MRQATTGAGSTLRRARRARGVSIDEASRDTRIRPEFLEALEDERYDRLLGDVHARGCLRSYATYLGLPGDELVRRYARQAPPPPPPSQPLPTGTRPPVGAARRRDNHRLFVMVAALVLVLAAAFGVLSGRTAAPPPAELPSEAPLAGSVNRPLQVVVLARQDVEVTVTVDDGAPKTFALRPDESRSFQGQVQVKVRLDHGASARIIVSGVDKGFPGRPGHPWKATYSYEQPSPSPTSAG
ncbi:MAG: helix-turn-helix domain-containing protein [Candidatus Velamenicoccus archaeovorus]